MGIHMLPPLYEIIITPPEEAVTATFYSEATPEVKVCDGNIGNIATFMTWAAIRVAEGDNVDHIATTMTCYLRVGSVAPPKNYYFLYRTIIVFDCSAILGKTASAAVLQVFGVSKSDTAAILPALNVYSAAPAAKNDLVPGDLNSLGESAFSTQIGYADFNTSGYNTFNINAAGLAWINTALGDDGLVALGLREAKYDATGVEPFPGLRNRIAHFAMNATEAGLTKRPMLTLTYS